jgi:O-Antigen ligase
VVGLLVFQTIAATWARDVDGAILGLFQLACACGVAIQVATRTDSRIPLRSTMVAVAFVLSLLALAQGAGFTTPLLLQASPPAATFGNKNVLGYALGALIPWVVGWSLGGRLGPRPYFAAAITCVVFSGALAVHSRGLLLSLVASLLAFAVTARKGALAVTWRSRALPRILGPAFVAMAAMWSWDARVSQQKQELVGLATGAGYSAQARLSFYAAGAEMAVTHPFGVGLGGFRAAFPSFANRHLAVPSPDFNLTTQPYEAHSDWVQLLAETGVLGPGLAAVAVAVVVNRLRRLRMGPTKALQTAVAVSSLAGTLAHALVDYPLHRPMSLCLFSVNLGLVLAALNGKPKVPFPSTVVRLVAGATMVFLLWTSASMLRAELLYKSALDLHANGRMDLSLQRLDDAAAVVPADFVARRFRAVVAYDLWRKGWGTLDRAAAACDDVLRIEPGQPRAHLMAGQLAKAQGNCGGAALHFQAVLAALPGDPLAAAAEKECRPGR